MLKVGFLINPIAGIGGAVALKGSDGVVEQARARGGKPRAPDRAARALQAAQPVLDQCVWFTWGGEMGERALREAGVEPRVLGHPADPATAADTRLAATRFAAQGIDLLVFVGGDGTARDLLESIGTRLPVLGVPAGVKMHSGVFAATPELAGNLLEQLVIGGLVQSVIRDVRDIDEAALRSGSVGTVFHGELRVPEPGGYLQHTKQGARESEPLALEEIVAEVVERLQEVDTDVVLGPGSTVAAIKRALGVKPTLLGFDVWRAGEQRAADVDARWLLSHTTTPVLVLSFTRNQGFLIGRGNQQLTPELLSRLPRDNLLIVGTRTKLRSLEGRPLLLDTDDPELDLAMSGLHEIITGYDDRLLYRLASHA